ncbi:MAG: CDP-diacylglycerol--serine O-phosphatidyltransferase [Clostridiaceae bacterium]
MTGTKISLPKALTYINIGLGVLSIIIAFQGGYKLSAALIVFACLAHRYQEKLCIYNTEAGKKLGLLTDMVFFGTAPSILLYLAYGFSDFGIYGYLAVLLFPLAAAHRLANTDISGCGEKPGGIPPVLAGAILAVFVFITADKHVVSAIAIILIAALSYMMLSKYKMKF